MRPDSAELNKIRLNENHRNRLLSYADECIRKLLPNTEIEKLRKELAPKVLAAVEKKYPAADMKVLKKYSKGREASCVHLTPGDGRVAEFNFPAGRGPWVPTRPYDSQIINVAPTLYRSVEKLERMSEVRDEEMRRRMEDYSALIRSSSTLGAVVAVWPQAADLLPEIKINLPSSLTQEAISRIKQDSQRLSKSNVSGVQQT